MGVLVSVMITVNGNLTTQYGLYTATVIIHIVGLLIISTVVLVRREKIFNKGLAWFLYLGGAIGVMTTIFNNISFGRISVSAILALGLLGQGVIGLIIDQYGLWGMPKHPFEKKKTFGFLLILAGIASMINSFEIVAVVVSFFAGITIVLSRTVNAKLADKTSVSVSTFFNYFVGIFVATLVLLVLGQTEIANNRLLFEGGFDFDLMVRQNWHIYLGGALGVMVVLLLNMIVVKIPALYLTLLIFVGKVFSGVVIDMIITQSVSHRNIIGGILVTAGMCFNLLIDRKKLV